MVTYMNTRQSDQFPARRNSFLRPQVDHETSMRSKNAARQLSYNVFLRITRLCCRKAEMSLRIEVPVEPESMVEDSSNSQLSDVHSTRAHPRFLLQLPSIRTRCGQVMAPGALLGCLKELIGAVALWNGIHTPL
jgi:hypothetical protein